MLPCVGSVLGGKLIFLPKKGCISMRWCNISMGEAAEVSNYLNRGEYARRCLNAADLGGVGAAGIHQPGFRGSRICLLLIMFELHRNVISQGSGSSVKTMFLNKRMTLAFKEYVSTSL